MSRMENALATCPSFAMCAARRMRPFMFRMTTLLELAISHRDMRPLVGTARATEPGVGTFLISPPQNAPPILWRRRDRWLVGVGYAKPCSAIFVTSTVWPRRTNDGQGRASSTYNYLIYQYDRGL